METETNFKIYNPLQQLEQGSIGGGGGSITPGSVTGGAGGSIANATITNINIAPGTITGGPGGNIGTGAVTGGTGGNIAPGTVTGGPGGDLASATVTGGTGGNIAAGTITGGSGGNIAANTITAGELAPGAAAANINAGPAGAINSSQIAGGPFLSAGTNAGNTQFGVVEFDPSGDLTQTSSNSGIALLKAGAVTNSKIAAGAVTGGPGGSIAPNTITNSELAAGVAAANINAGPAGSINSSQISGGPFLSLSGGTMTGAITQPLAPVAGTDLANKSYVDSLSGPKAFAKFIKQVPQNMTAGTATVITWPIQETPTANATSAAGNITMAGTGVATLTSTSTAETAWRVVFSGQSIQDPTTSAGRINFDVFNNTTSTSVGNNSAAFCFAGALPQAFTDAYLQEYFVLAPSATVSFSIRGTNPGANVISLGTSGSNTNPLLCIEQIY